MGWFRKAEKVVEDTLETAKADAQWAVSAFTDIVDQVESVVADFSSVADDADTQITALTGRKNEALAHLAHYSTVVSNLRALFPAPPATGTDAPAS